MPSGTEATSRWLNDIRHHISMAEGFVAGMSDEAFKDDSLHLDAVIRCLEIISEASRRLPDEVKARHPSVAWKNMAGAGNVYRHDYEDVAASFVWVVYQRPAHHCRDDTDVEYEHHSNRGGSRSASASIE